MGTLSQALLLLYAQHEWSLTLECNIAERQVTSVAEVDKV
jgi:hypothetical protein